MGLRWRMKGAVIDFETTDIRPKGAAVTQVALVTWDRTFCREGHYEFLLDPGNAYISDFAREHTTWGKLSEEERQRRYVDPITAWTAIANVCQYRSLMAHNLPFEKMWLEHIYSHPALVNLPWAKKIHSGKAFALSIDTLRLADPLKAQGILKRTRLTDVARFFGVHREGAHDALIDCEMTLDIARPLLGVRIPGADRPRR